MAVFGPRTVQIREKFKVLLNAVDYDEDDKAKVVVSLVGKDSGEQIKSHIVDLKTENQFLEFDVSFLYLVSHHDF